MEGVAEEKSRDIDADGCVSPDVALSDVLVLQQQPDVGVFRVGIRDRKVEQMVTVKGLQLTGYWGLWLGLAPDDSPLLLKDTGSQEIVALDWQTP